MAEWKYGLLFDSAKEFLSWLQTVRITANITGTHVHHTWAPSHKDFTGSNHRALQDAMRNYHVNSRGWSDIGQHLTIFPDGRVITGRNINRAPASATNYNGTDAAHPFMFEMVGNFDSGHDVLQGRQLESALEICRYFGNVVFHRECLINGKEPKSCPGTGINKEWFMKMVAQQPQQPKEEKKDDISGHWAEAEIRKVIAEGKMKGRPNGFEPDAPITRAEIAYLIARGVI